jgi:hypothetical protein
MCAHATKTPIAFLIEQARLEEIKRKEANMKMDNSAMTIDALLCQTVARASPFV